MAADPWADWRDRDVNGKGKGKGHPVTPEPAVTGALIVGTALLTVAVVRWRARRLSAATLADAQSHAAARKET